MISNKKVAVIGAGLSGLCFSKYINQIGDLEPTIFEKTNDIGGAWSNSSNRKSWDSLKLNTNQLSMSFSDFLFKNQFPNKEEIFPSNKTFYEYLKSFVENFELINYIKFNSNVIKIEKNVVVDENESNCKWKVVWEFNNNNNNNQSIIYSEIFDYVVICTGAFSKSSTKNDLEIKLKQFKGDIIHSENYRNPELLKGKKVLIVGSSFSACEIANDVCKEVSKCIQIGHENFYAVNTFLPNEDGKHIPWDMLFFTRKSIYEKNNNYKTDQELWEVSKKMLIQICPNQDLSKNPNSKIPIKTTPENQPPIGFTVSRNYYENVESGKIITYTGDNYKIHSVDGNSITFSNDKGEVNTVDKIDSIIVCSGYQIEFPFLENDVLEDICYDSKDQFLPMCIYEHTFPSKFKSIAFIGCVKGIFLTEIEMYCRWVSLVFSGKLEYPNDEKLSQGKNDILKLRSVRPRPQFPILDCVYHCDKIAKEIGCLPDFESIKINDPELYNKLWNGFFCQASYNLIGPGSNPTLAKEIINNYYENYQQFKN
ncbi:flavin-containing monooxygenase [Dictyostelium discoideum AX4]|uniref:Flavin-containing monooxygenase n=1 Tax=Dictyostelium discoideum TaxID=44689 RepID=Q54GT4_DICDI|nr:flavin-containing monooxygenase [Dictyostelium discoideum AX4]EAL62475.1 flavin-containing monooxygenase [Dictyostelium discoideum AX4]|eukprot:XP_635985.1 flavin-containing monooxygenase [Dictyostelium discoideum AX4]